VDHIRLTNMRFFARHGLFQEEATLGQRFEVDLTVSLNLRTAGLSDNMNDSVHYGELYEVVRSVAEQERFNLLEALSERIAGNVLAYDGRICSVEVTVRKPSVPIPGILDCAEVMIRRERNGDNMLQSGQ